MNTAERLNLFLDWCSRMGVPPAKLDSAREIAGYLLQLAGDGPVTETHIQTAMAVWSTLPDGASAIPFVQRTGELLIRVEKEKLAVDGASAATFQVSLPPAPPPTARFPSRGSALPPPSPARSISPPTVAFVTPPVAPVPSSVSAPPSPAVAASSGSIVIVATPPGTPEPPPASVRAPAPSRAGKLFRCSKCATIVMTNDEGVCPLCGLPPPAAPEPTETPPGMPAAKAAAAPAEPEGTNWFLFGAALFVSVLAAGAGALIGYKVSQAAFAPGPRVTTISGLYRSEYLRLQAVLPSGWHHLEGEDFSDSGVITTRGSCFYQGESIESPDVALLLGSSKDSRISVDLATLSDVDFVASLQGSVKGLVRRLGPDAAFNVEDCEVMSIGTRRTARCTGEVAGAPGRSDTRRLLLVYFWGMDSAGLGAAIFVSRLAADRTLRIAENIVMTVEEYPRR